MSHETVERGPFAIEQDARRLLAAELEKSGCCYDNEKARYIREGNEAFIKTLDPAFAIRAIIAALTSPSVQISEREAIRAEAFEEAASFVREYAHDGECIARLMLKEVNR